MKAYVIDKDIELPDLASKLVEVEEPEADGDADEVLIDVYSSALNFFDILQIQGKYQVKRPFPYVLGTEVAGILSKNSPIPEGCNWTPGKTRVFGMANGSYTEKASADWNNLREVPDGISLEGASGLFVTWPTSYAALKFRADVQPGEWVCVHAGAGGVGICAIQIAKALGAKVIATSGSAEKLRVCKEIGGADEAVNYRDSDWQQQVKDLTDGGVDVVYDPVGMIIPSLKFIKWNGRIVVVGFAAGTIEKVPANLILLKQCSVMGVFWGAHTAYEPERIPEAWDAIFKLLESKKCRPTVFDKVFDGLATLPGALKDLQDRKTWGKVVIRVKEDPLFPSTSKPKL
ncbi:hypothetical protein CBS101457_001698 [Exobasidium rhododendri]|nr:hypothetical protein CBS101457_001698 [Exobasidium rhododendri]